jgi:hypothetical protein
MPFHGKYTEVSGSNTRLLFAGQQLSFSLFSIQKLFVLCLPKLAIALTAQLPIIVGKGFEYIIDLGYISWQIIAMPLARPKRPKVTILINLDIWQVPSQLNQIDWQVPCNSCRFSSTPLGTSLIL